MDMRGLGLALVLGLCAAGGLAAATEVRLLETFPVGEDIVVAPNANLYLRVAYTLDTPQHVWLRPYFQGKPAQAGSGGSPVYSGSGELLGWFFLMQDGAEVDEIRVSAGDGSHARTQPIASWPWHVVARAGTAAAGSEPAWVATLRAQREAAERAAAAAWVEPPMTGLDRMLVFGFMLGVPLLGLFGTLAPLWGLWRWRGPWRIAAALPALAMAWIVLRIVVDTSRDPTSHNLWPFEILIVGGLSSAVMLVLFVARALILRNRPARG